MRLTSKFSGSFYPANPQQLSAQINQFLKQVPPKNHDVPVALLVPHAGYIYSVGTAAYAYKQLEGSSFETVVVLGPSHQVYTSTLAIPDGTGYETPLGFIDFDMPMIKNFLESGLFECNSIPHEREHSLEVQFPFIQTMLPKAKLLPISVGEVEAKTMAKAGQFIASRMTPKTLLVISSDLSHYHSLKIAKIIDNHTIQAIMSLSDEDLISAYRRKEAECCGIYPILLAYQVFKNLGKSVQPKLLHYDTSASASFDDQHVVGYSAIQFS